MTSLEEATERLARAIEQLERVVGQLPVGAAAASAPALPSETAALVAARLDAAIGRLDRLLEE